MSRAALLYTTGDPLIASGWLRFFPLWKGEVDQLYVSIASGLPAEIKEQTAKLFEQAGAIVVGIYNWNPDLPYSPILNELVDAAKEEFFFLSEDDGYILEKGVVDKNFRILETGEADFLGSKRGSCSAGLLAREKELWLPGDEGFGDVGPNFWPFLIHTSKKVLDLTDRDWDKKQWQSGTYIPELDWTCTEPEAGDGLVFLSIQLRANDLRFRYLPHHHLSFLDPEKHAIPTGPWGLGDIPWCHIGSMSFIASWLGYLKQDPVWLENLKSVPDIAREDILKRLGIYSLLYDNYANHCGNYSDSVKDCIFQITAALQADKEEIEKYIKVYSSLFLKEI